MRQAASWKALVTALMVCFYSLFSPVAKAQGTEERFQDLFVTAGYCAAFGAALGTAMLAFTANPSDNLKLVAMGASLGFIGGSALGTYIIFSPAVSDNTDTGPAGSLALDQPLPEKGIVLRPTYDRSKQRVTSIEGGMTLARF